MKQDDLLNKIQEKVKEINPQKNVFDAIFYNDNLELDVFISNLNQEQAIFCLIEACKKSYERGTFNIVESELVSKSIRILEK